VLRRAELGTPREELRAAREAHAEAVARRKLAEAGSRPEDVSAAQAEALASEQEMRLVERGPRTEDIASAKARLAQAQALLDELRAGARRQTVEQAKATARAAGARSAEAKSRAMERIVPAPIDGLVERVSVAVGDLVQAGAALLRMSDPRDVWLRVYVAEAKLAQVAVGDEATLRVDGIAEELPAVVEAIATQGEFTPANLQTAEERGKQVFAVRLKLRKPDARVKAGMYATVLRLGKLK
jgi:HlyD family secretion protein